MILPLLQVHLMESNLFTKRPFLLVSPTYVIGSPPYTSLFTEKIRWWSGERADEWCEANCLVQTIPLSVLFKLLMWPRMWTHSRKVSKRVRVTPAPVTLGRRTQLPGLERGEKHLYLQRTEESRSWIQHIISTLSCSRRHIAKQRRRRLTRKIFEVSNFCSRQTYVGRKKNCENCDSQRICV